MAMTNTNGRITQGQFSFLPDLTELTVRVALAEQRGEPDEEGAALLGAVRRLHEQNPMLGLRGVRLGLVVPGVGAIAAAASHCGPGSSCLWRCQPMHD